MPNTHDNEYRALVRGLKKSGDVIQSELTGVDCDILHMAMGISTEAGELLDAVKKAVIYRKPLDVRNILEELGDLEFFMEGLRQQLHMSRDEVLMENIRKLSKRYHTGTYSDTQAQTRADKT